MDMWMYWTTAVIFTVIGFWMGRNEGPTFEQSKKITQETIDTLIDMGYIKTRTSGEDVEMLKYYDNEE